jgi:hypothetical protein
LQNDSANTSDGVVDSGVNSQAIVLSGKIYVNENGKYRIALRGRYNIALFVSIDGGTTYQKAAEYQNKSGSADFPNTEGTYADLELKGDSWVYFKAVMIRYAGESRNAFMGLGWGKWTESEEVSVDEADGTVDEEDAVPASVTVNYLTAYRCSYEQLDEEEFKSDYLFTRDYKYSYSGIINVGQTTLTEQCIFSEGWEHKLEYLNNGEDNNYMHTSYNPTTERPVRIVIKLDQEVTANRLIFDGSHNSEKGWLPKDFKIWVSKDGSNWQLVCDVTDSTLSDDNWQVTADFDGLYTFTYYKFEVTASHGSYIALRKTILQNVVKGTENGKQITPDNNMFTYTGNWELESTYSSFGHIYVGGQGDTLEFTFEGTRLGILSVQGFGTNFTVEIDGVEVSSIDLIQDESIYASFISGELSSGTHTVKITCNGEANFDSIVVW